MNWPNPLTNQTSGESWLNSFLRASRASEIVSVIGGKLTKTTNGKVLVIDRQQTPVANAADCALVQFKIISDGGDYWLCNTWDGTTLGTNGVRVTKPKKLRSGSDAIASEVVRGTTQSYSYTPVNVGAVVGYYIRDVTVGGALVERDIIIPVMVAGDIIDALPHPNYGEQLTTASVYAGGTGYTNNDVLTVVGGTGSAATLRATVTAGVITSVAIIDPGSYTAAPSSPAAVTGGTGSSATFNLTLDTGYRVIADGCAWAEM